MISKDHKRHLLETTKMICMARRAHASFLELLLEVADNCEYDATSGGKYAQHALPLCYFLDQIGYNVDFDACRERPSGYVSELRSSIAKSKYRVKISESKQFHLLVAGFYGWLLTWPQRWSSSEKAVDLSEYNNYLKDIETKLSQILLEGCNNIPIMEDRSFKFSIPKPFHCPDPRELRYIQQKYKEKKSQPTHLSVSRSEFIANRKYALHQLGFGDNDISSLNLLQNIRMIPVLSGDSFFYYGFSEIETRVSFDNNTVAQMKNRLGDYTSDPENWPITIDCEPQVAGEQLEVELVAEGTDRDPLFRISSANGGSALDFRSLILGLGTFSSVSTNDEITVRTMVRLDKVVTIGSETDPRANHPSLDEIRQILGRGIFLMRYNTCDQEPHFSGSPIELIDNGLYLVLQRSPMKFGDKE